MNVYIVYGASTYEGIDFFGVYTTRELAQHRVAVEAIAGRALSIEESMLDGPTPDLKIEEVTILKIRENNFAQPEILVEPRIRGSLRRGWMALGDGAYDFWSFDGTEDASEMAEKVQQEQALVLAGKRPLGREVPK